jgi:hypothetical protein
MSVGALWNRFLQESKEESFVEKNLVGIAFAVSNAVLFLLQPTIYILGVAAGFSLHHYNWIPPRKDPEGRLIPLENTVFAVVGAVASLATRTFALPFSSSVTIGITFDMMVRS